MATLTHDLPLSKPSMAESLPSINFGFEDLRERMAKFTVRFDAFIERERKRVLDERNQFRMSVAELQGNRTPFAILRLV
jgi:kinetochore protein Spc25